jgi:hypothetical protein
MEEDKSVCDSKMRDAKVCHIDRCLPRPSHKTRTSTRSLKAVTSGSHLRLLPQRLNYHLQNEQPFCNLPVISWLNDVRKVVLVQNTDCLRLWVPAFIIFLPKKKETICGKQTWPLGQFLELGPHLTANSTKHKNISWMIAHHSFFVIKGNVVRYLPPTFTTS